MVTEMGATVIGYPHNPSFYQSVFDEVTEEPPPNPK